MTRLRRTPKPITKAAQRRIYRQERRNALPLYAAILFTTVIVALAFIHRPSSLSISPVSRTSRATTPQGLNDLVVSTTVRAAGFDANYCNTINGQTPNNFLRSSNRAWLVFLLPAIVFLFVGLAIVTDDYFVPSLERICEQLKLDEDVAGATFMAAGSSAPELFTSLLAALLFKDDIGIGTIAGSAIFNILIIIGLSAALAKETLLLDPRPLIRDSAFYILSIILLILFVMFVGGQRQPDGSVITAGKIQWWEGLIFVLVYGIYILFMSFGNKPYMRFMKRVFPKTLARNAGEADIGIDIEEGMADNNNIEGKDEDQTQGSVSTPSPASTPETNTQQSPQQSQLYPNNINNQSLQSNLTPAQLNALERRSSQYYQKNPRSHMRVLTLAIIAANSLATNSEQDADGDDAPRTDQMSSLDNNVVVNAGDIDGGDNAADRLILWGFMKRPSKFGWLTVPIIFPWKVVYWATMIDCQKEERKKWWPATFTVAIVWIMIISFLMVEATRLSGCYIGIPSAVMGLTLLAAGTSVPDALASVSVARNGFGNMAVSNAIGSNVFDILLGLGLPWFIAGLALPEKITNISVEPLSLVVIPIAILFVVIVLLVGILVFLKWKLTKPLGYILFALYGAFIVYNVLDVYIINKDIHNQPL